MIDKLKRIASIEPALLAYLNIRMDNLENWLSSSDRRWQLVGRVVDDLQRIYPDTNIYIGPANADQLAFVEIGDEIVRDAPTLLEAVCDAWLALKGGE